MELSTYPHSIYTTKGIHMVILDTLSQNPQFAENDESEEEYTLLLPDHTFINHINLLLQT